jgi:hypothetical protein
MKRAWTRGHEPKAGAVVEGEAVMALFLFIVATHVVRISGGQATGPEREGREGVHRKYFIATIITFPN